MTSTTQRRLIGGLVAVIVVISCIFLGRWQWQRHEDRSAQVDQITSNYEQAPVEFSQLITDPQAPMPPELEWRPITVTGRYEAPIIQIRNRPVDGQPGFHIAQPFRFSEGTLLVNRGFINARGEIEPEFSAQSETEVTLTGRLRPAEPADNRTPPTGQGFTLNPDQLLENQTDLVTGAYLVATSENPAAPQEIVPLPPPDTDLGSHFSYALQWWFFAGGAVVAFFLLIQRENQFAGKRPEVKKTPTSAEAEEDALIAAWEAQQDA